MRTAMLTFLADWLNLIFRWAHMIAGIGWIGTSFYFIALDFSLRKRERMNPGVAGTASVQKMLDATQRSGILTQSGFLTITGASNGSNPVKRGRKIYERFMCGELPPPPPNVPPPKPASAGGTTRERFEEHDQMACAA